MTRDAVITMQEPQEAVRTDYMIQDTLKESHEAREMQRTREKLTFSFRVSSLKVKMSDT